MPNEKINDYVSQGWYTEVSWRRRPGLDSDDQGTASGHVQLATVNALSPFHFPDIDTGDHFEAGEKFDGWRVTLDEAGIDRLIKTLHKAKRQAFGEPKPLADDEHVLRDVTEIGDSGPRWVCIRPEHDGQQCQVDANRYAYPQRIVLSGLSPAGDSSVADFIEAMAKDGQPPRLA